MASRRRDLSRPLLIVLCLVAAFAVGSESHGLEDFTGGKAEGSPEMDAFFGAKPEAAALPEALDSATSLPAKPEAASATPATVASSGAASPPRRSVSVAAAVACAVAGVAFVGVAVAVAYVVRARRGGRREPEVRLGSP